MQVVLVRDAAGGGVAPLKLTLPPKWAARPLRALLDAYCKKQQLDAAEFALAREAREALAITTWIRAARAPRQHDPEPRRPSPSPDPANRGVGKTVAKKITLALAVLAKNRRLL